MKKKLIIIVILVIAFFSALPFLCHKAEYKRDDYIGVYYYDLAMRQDNFPDFIVLYQDSTYTHQASDGHYARGKYCISKHGTHRRHGNNYGNKNIEKKYKYFFRFGTHGT